MRYALINPNKILESVSSAPTSNILDGWLQVEVDLSNVPNHATHDYWYNVTEKKFFEVGVKSDIVKDTVVTSPFADNTGLFFRGTGIVNDNLQGIIDSKSEHMVNEKIDLQLPAETDRDINGLHLYLKNHTWYDRCDFQIVDKDFLYKGSLYPETPFEAGLPAAEGAPWSSVVPDGVVLNTFGAGWNIDHERVSQKAVILPIKASILEGMVIRLNYTHCREPDTEALEVKANYFLYEDRNEND